MIMWELSSRKVPFEDLDMDFRVIQKVVKGDRPPITRECPMFYNTLLIRCWAQRAEERPEISEAVQVLEAHQEEFAVV